MEIGNEALGRRIKSIRTEKGLTTKEFGKLVEDASDSLVSRWERGVNKPNNKRLKRIAELGGISLDELLYGEKKSKYDADKLRKVLTDVTFVPFQEKAFNDLINALNEAYFISFGFPEILTFYSNNVAYDDKIKDLKSLLEYLKKEQEGLSSFLEDNEEDNENMIMDLSINLYSINQHIEEIENYLKNK